MVGRSAPGGPVDDLTLTAGHWAQGPGQVVWEDSQNGVNLPVGTRITVTGVPGTPKLTIVGTATSITGTAQAWVTPAELTSWTGYAIISGSWYQGHGQVDVNTAFLTDTGTAVGDIYPLASGGRHVTVRIAGEVFEPGGGRAEVFGGLSTLAAVDPYLTPGQYDVGLQPGVNAQAYANALSAALGGNYGVNARGGNSTVFAVIMGLIAMLTLLLSAVAGLGVLNTVVLQTRERVHDLGVFKAIGMTPRQTVAMVVCSVAEAGLIAIPVGVALHHYILPVMGNAAQTGLPASVLNVYNAPELALLALSGLAIAVLGALAPAGWAAKTRTAFALRAE